MATRAFLFTNSEGWPEEQASTDDIVVGGIASSGDVALNSGATVTGLPNPPPSGDAAASKDYVDSVATGLDVKESARLCTTTDLVAAGWTISGSGVGKTLTSPTNATSNNDFDGVTAALNDRILVKEEGTALHNGIYTITQLADGAAAAAILTRATDADEDAEVTAGMFLFVTEGTTCADTGWVLISNDPIVVDTNAQSFAQFSGAGSFTGGDGIDITGNVISVDLSTTPGLQFNSGELEVLVDPAGAIAVGAGGLAVQVGDGIEITGNAVAVDLAATNPGLQFSSGDLAFLPDPAGAIVVSAAGAAVNVDGSSITIVGNQLVAVANPAPRLEAELTANEALANGDAVEWGGAADEIRECRANTTARIDCFGVVEEVAGISASGTGTIVRRGIATGVLTGATVGQRFFVGSSGGLVQGTGSLAAGEWIIFVGTAVNATDLEVNPQVISRKAA